MTAAFIFLWWCGFHLAHASIYDLISKPLSQTRLSKFLFGDSINVNGDVDQSWYEQQAGIMDISTPSRYDSFSNKVYAQFREPFPEWLTELTQLYSWPGEHPPYIPMSSVNLSLVPSHIPRRKLGDCSSVERSHCSFDCYRCISTDDIASCPVLSQTFDDGPSPSTPKLLEELPVRTTFFTQGINVIRFPNIFRQQHADGHLLASHTWSHGNLPGLSNEEIAAQIQWSIWAMNATAGVVPKYFRPPYGAIDDRVRAITRQFGLIAVFWDRDTFDWRVNDNTKTEYEVYSDLRRWQSEGPSGLILEHDSTIKTVNVGINMAMALNQNQKTVAECVNGPWYQN